MKKHYIIPAIKSQDMTSDEDILSLSTASFDGDHDIEIGEPASDGDVSDSRRSMTIWED